MAEALTLAVDRCSYCHDQCMSGTPELLATKDQSMAVSRVATMLRQRRLREAPWDAALSTRVFLGLDDGLQFESCIYRHEGHRIEPYLRAARRDAIAAGHIPASVAVVQGHAIATGNVFGLVETLADPVHSLDGTPILVHDAAVRALMPEALVAARRLLLAVDGRLAEVAVASCGAVEADLGLDDLAHAAAGRMAARLAAMPPGPLVTIDAAVAIAIMDMETRWGITIGRPVAHLSTYLAGHDRLPRVEPRARVSVVLHDSGALARGLGILDAPRILLRAVAGGGLREAVPSGRLASSDGPVAGYPRPDIALVMARTRARQLTETGADCIITACPSSLRNLRSAEPDRPVLDLWSLVDAGWQDDPEMAVQELLHRTSGPGTVAEPPA